MILISWLFDKLGYMPKIAVETNWHFPATQKDYVAPEFEKPVTKQTATKSTTKVAKKATKVAAKKTVRKKKA